MEKPVEFNRLFFESCIKNISETYNITIETGNYAKRFITITSYIDLQNEYSSSISKVLPEELQRLQRIFAALIYGNAIKYINRRCIMLLQFKGLVYKSKFSKNRKQFIIN